MFISVTCTCGKHYETPEANAGCRAQCPDCGRVLIVPQPMQPPEELFLPSEPEPSATSGKAIASVALGALFFGACLSGLPAILLGREALSEIRLSKGRLRGRRLAVTGIILGVIGCLFTVALLLPVQRSAREAARRSMCVNNLKLIGLAMYNYHEANGSLPTAAITDKNGRPLLSWRVAILPYLETGDLYAKFHLDEPWNSPHNLSLLDAMPNTFACPSDKTWKRGMTEYQAVIGPDTAFTPDFKPLEFRDFTDGTANTILIGESRHGVPWTKPEDLPFDMTVPFTGLGSHHGYHNDGFNALFADGSVHFLKSSIAPNTLSAILTRNDLVPVGPDSF